MIAHENCAIAVHTMRKNRVRSDYKERYLRQIEEQVSDSEERSDELGMW